jgi:putative FmdB family regulatory protein
VPTYTYRCEKCKKKFDHFQKITSAPLRECRDETCDGKLKRLIGPGGGIIFKGDGWTPRFTK